MAALDRLYIQACVWTRSGQYPYRYWDLRSLREEAIYLQARMRGFLVRRRLRKAAPRVVKTKPKEQRRRGGGGSSALSSPPSAGKSKAKESLSAGQAWRICPGIHGARAVTRAFRHFARHAIWRRWMKVELYSTPPAPFLTHTPAHCTLTELGPSGTPQCVWGGLRGTTEY